MQIRAVFEAAVECLREGREVEPEIMVPQVCTVQELKLVRSQLDEIRREVEAEQGIQVPCRFGSMIEVVRSCLRAESMAEVAEFFSFGINDLTQAVFSFSREDAENKRLGNEASRAWRGAWHDQAWSRDVLTLRQFVSTRKRDASAAMAAKPASSHNPRR
jgi:phosphoenolpyruvate synthase/pyruvate phosphate dikinase